MLTGQRYVDLRVWLPHTMATTYLCLPHTYAYHTHTYAYQPHTQSSQYLSMPTSHILVGISYLDCCSRAACMHGGGPRLAPPAPPVADGHPRLHDPSLGPPRGRRVVRFEDNVLFISKIMCYLADDVFYEFISKIILSQYSPQG